MDSIQDIMEMLNLFYANKHMYEKVRASRERLEQWKADANHKPLIVRGARQIGKTESIRQFARTHYANVVEINFVFLSDTGNQFPV